MKATFLRKRIVVPRVLVQTLQHHGVLLTPFHAPHFKSAERLISEEQIHSISWLFQIKLPALLRLNALYNISKYASWFDCGKRRQYSYFILRYHHSQQQSGRPKISPAICPPNNNKKLTHNRERQGLYSLRKIISS